MGKEKMSEKWDRRSFLKALGLGISIPYLANFGVLNFSRGNSQQIGDRVEAKYYEKLKDKKIRCDLCPRKCEVANLERGYCGVRENFEGVYYTLVHSKPCTYHIDPIEKKPFFHVLPGSLAFSIATAGCNMLCKFCQNWQISQVRPEQVPSYDFPPEKLVQAAKQQKCKSISYTYTEPVVFYEYILDTAKLTKGSEIKSVVVSNGFIMPEPLKEWCKYIDAMKVDLKAFTEKFYKEICDATLKPVLDAIVTLKQSGVWLEIVYLVVPTLNDNYNDIREMAKWLKTNVGVDVPFHFSRFYPTYQIQNLPPTPVETLEKAREIFLQEGHNYVYIGNVPGHKGENTYCPGCKETIIKRMGYYILDLKIRDGKCGKCGRIIPGLWS